MDNNISFSTLILQQFKEYGEKNAIIYEDDGITYNELLIKIIGYSDVIIDLNAKSVAINTDNKMKCIILGLSCILAGVPFIVIDNNNPLRFNMEILAEAKIDVVICDKGHKVDGFDNISYEALISKAVFGKDYVAKMSPEVIFYVATSGSSGKPKVAERFLQAFWSDYRLMGEKLTFMCNQVAQQYAKLNFSYGLENSLLLLLRGTTICFGGASVGIQDFELMYDEICKNRATIVFWASPIIKLFSKHHRLCDNIPDCVRYIYTGGEPLVISADLVVEFHNRKITLINDYGCSELGKVFAHPFAMQLRDMEAYNPVGIGEPLGDYEAKILDENMNEVMEGRLHLKSSARFLCSYVDKQIKVNEIYKDGYWYYDMNDIAKWMNGGIVVLGREMNSVNVLGHRIELEQIEYIINRIEGIEHCIVIPHYNEYREANIYCFYTGNISAFYLRAQLMDLMPDYMIPNSFSSVEKVYLLPNAKVDRKKNKQEYLNSINLKSKDIGEVKERIYSYLVNILGGSPGNINDVYLKPFSEYGVDSLSVVDFISTIEEKERVLITGDGIGSKITCLKDIVDLTICGKEIRK